MCSDNEGSSKFSCICKPQYFGDHCEFDRCDSYPCQNNGTCIVTLINDIPTPECECSGNYGGPTCNLDLCLDINCGNGTCIGGTCQCNTNYVNIGNKCEQTCALANCKVSDINIQYCEDHNKREHSFDHDKRMINSCFARNNFYPSERMKESASMMMHGIEPVANVLVLLLVKHVR